MSRIRVRTASDAFAPNPVVKAIEMLGRGNVIAFRSGDDGYAVIYVTGVGAEQAIQMLKQAGIEATVEG